MGQRDRDVVTTVPGHLAPPEEKEMQSKPASPKCSSSQFLCQAPSYFLWLPVFPAICSDINFMASVKRTIQIKVGGTLVLIPGSSQAP